MQNEVEVMRVVRVPPRGDLVILVGDDRYQHISNIKDSTKKRRILAAIGELIAFADGYDTLVQAGLAPTIIAADENESSDLDRQRAAFITSMERERDSMQTVTDQELSAAQSAGKQAGDETGPLSIADLINPIITKHLASESQLSGRTMRLESDPSGGLSIIVDDRAYQRPEEIEDSDMRRVLRASLKEWDES